MKKTLTMLGVFALWAWASLPAQAVTVTEFTVAANSEPTGIIQASDGAIWYTAKSGNSIHRVDASTGTVTNSYTVPTANAGPTALVQEPGTNFIWFTEQTADKIGRIDTSNLASATIVEFSAGVTVGGHPNAIAAGPAGDIYFTELDSGKLLRVNHSNGNITTLTTYASGSRPAGIVQGPEGDLWVTLSGLNQIARFNVITPTPTPTPYTLPTNSEPIGITVGPDNFIWFTESGIDRVGKIDPAGTVITAEYSSGITTGSRPNFITSAGGVLWYTTKTTGASRLGRVTTDGNIIETTSGITSGGALNGVTGGPADTVWFASTIDRLGKATGLNVVPAVLQFEKGEFQANEICKEALIRVTRSGDITSAVTVNYATSDVSGPNGATSGEDYESKSGTLTFPAGSSSSQQFVVKILDGGGIEEIEDVTLTLSQPTGGATLGGRSVSKIQIYDATRPNDGRGDDCDKPSRGGCALSTSRQFDPMLPLMALGALTYVIRRRRMNNLRKL